MSLGVGLDFGTSNSSIAVYNGTQMQLIPLDPAGAESSVIRSLLYLTRSGDRFVGQEAFERHQLDNIGRPVRLERTRVGDVSMTFSGVGTITTETFAVVDANEPGRLFQSVKSLLPDRMFTKTNVFGVDLTAEDLVVLLAGEIVSRATRQLGQPVRRLTVGRPVHFSGKLSDDELARTRLTAAMSRLGVETVEFLEEPIAAALSFVHRTGPSAALVGPAVVFDFGGGTLDVSVIRAQQDGMTVLSSGGISVGGDLLDRRIVEARMLRHFGEGATFGSGRLPVPRHVLSRVLDWQTLYLLNRPEGLELLEEMAGSGSRPRELRNLRTLVTHNYGAALFRAVERGKQELSLVGQTTIGLTAPEIDVHESLTRDEFEGIIRPQHDMVRRCVEECVAAAALAPGEVLAVVATGGSSRIPMFRQTLRTLFPNAELVEQDTFTSVAAGLALAGYAAETQGSHR